MSIVDVLKPTHSQQKSVSYFYFFIFEGSFLIPSEKKAVHILMISATYIRLPYTTTA